MTLARKYRLGRDGIKHVMNVGKTVRGSFFFIKFLVNNSGHTRIAVTVSLKVSKKSVHRNKIKRMATRLIEKVGVLEKPLDAVIVAVPSIVGKSNEEIKRDLETIIKKTFVNKANN